MEKRLNKKGISGVVTAVLLIALVLVITAIVWGVVQNLVEDELESAESCFGNYGEVEINNAFTCYNSSRNELQISVDVGEVDLGGLLVAVSGEGIKKSFKITEAGLTETYLKNYGDSSFGTTINFPEANSGRTYVVNLGPLGFSEKPFSIELSPIMGGEQCGVSDSLLQIDSCDLLAA